MTQEDYAISDLTPPVVSDILKEFGGGMVQSVIVGLEFAATDGMRHFVALWDNESSLASQLGLEVLLQKTLSARANIGWEQAIDD